MASKIGIKRIFWWLVYAVWIAGIGLLISGVLNSPRGGLRAPGELLSGVKLAAEASWMGVYLKNQKIGYIRTEIEPLKHGGFEIREFSSLQGAMMGARQQMRMRMTVTTDSTLALVSFQGRLESDPYATAFSGWVKNKVLTIEVTSGGKKTEKYLPAPEPIYLSQAIKPLLHAGRLDDGDSLKLAGFDPMTLEMQDLIVVGASLETYHLWGEDVQARKLITRLSGFSSEVYVDREGNTIAEFGPLGMLMRREEMEIAISIDDSKNSVDFLAIYAIKPQGSIKAPRRAKYSKFKITGYEIDQIAAASQRQEIVDAKAGIIEVFSFPQTSVKALDNLEELTRDAPYIESREKDLISAAQKAASGATTRADTLRQLSDWVFHAVNKKPSAGIPSALAVLKRLEGDCNEHSVLFTALARALGIPTRIQLGVVYQQGRFYYHAWVASWVNGAWVEYDPTFGQPHADAARIALTAGDLTDAIKLVSAVEHMQIEIIESE